MKAVILAAGMGTRLGTLIPKPLTALEDEKTILDFQVERLSRAVGVHNIFVVVGYKFQLIMERYPQLMYVYNHEYTRTNTAKSLLMALDKIRGEDALWLNGDVFFDYDVLTPIVAATSSCCLVDEAECRDEEIKYKLNDAGEIVELSKRVADARGEAVGINMLKSDDLAGVCEELRRVDDKDYFERALENLASTGRLVLKPVYIGDRFCQEIDFPHDLSSVRKYLKANPAGRPSSAEV